MKAIIILLTAITLLSCEKEELKPINGDITVIVKNTIEIGTSPKGFNVEYYENGVLIKDEFKYVGNPYRLEYSSSEPLRFKAYNEGHNINIVIRYNDNYVFERNGYKEIIINEIIYDEPINIVTL